MRRGDFVRQMPASGQDFGAGATLGERLRVDFWLLLILLALCGYGLVVLYSASGRNMDTVERQAGLMLAGLVAMVGVAQLGVKQLRRWTPVAYLVGCLLLLAVDLVGIGAKGAQRWLEIPGLPRFQPSEIMKLVVPLAVSSFLAASVLPPRLVHVMVTIAIVAVPTVLVLIQPDLGTAVLIAAAGLIVLFLAGLQLALGSCDFARDKGERFVTLGTAALAVWNVGIAFVFGILLLAIVRRGWFKL